MQALDLCFLGDLRALNSLSAGHETAICGMSSYTSDILTIYISVVF